MENKTKAQTFIGFAIRSNKYRIGMNAVQTLKKINLLIVCCSASDNTKEEARKVANKYHCKLITTKEVKLEEITHKENSKVMAVIDKSAVNRAIKIGVCNIFHGCVHNMLHEKREDILRGLYKSASFVVQAIIFQQTGNYIKHQEELLAVAKPNEQAIINTFLSLKKGGTVDFIPMSDRLFVWAKQWISENS